MILMMVIDAFGVDVGDGRDGPIFGLAYVDGATPSWIDRI